MTLPRNQYNHELYPQMYYEPNYNNYSNNVEYSNNYNSNSAKEKRLFIKKLKDQIISNQKQNLVSLQTNKLANVHLKTFSSRSLSVNDIQHM